MIDQGIKVLKLKARSIRCLDDVVDCFGKVQSAGLRQFHGRRNTGHDLVKVPSCVCRLCDGIGNIVSMENGGRCPLGSRDIQFLHHAGQFPGIPAVDGRQGHLSVRHTQFIFAVYIDGFCAEINQFLAHPVDEGSKL